MSKRGVTCQSLADALGCDKARLTNWRTRAMPTLETAQRLSEALVWPSLLELVRDALTGSCALCGGTFVAESGRGERRFCSDRCSFAFTNRKRRGCTLQGVSEVIARHRLTEYQQAIEAMCRGCEPEGLCRDSGCSLRAVSPLRLAGGERQELPVVTFGQRVPRSRLTDEQVRTRRDYHREWMRAKRAVA